MNDRTRYVLQRFNWIGGGIMLAVYVLLNLFAPGLHVVIKLAVALLAAILVFALIESARRKRQSAEAEEAREEDPKEQ